MRFWNVRYLLSKKQSVLLRMVYLKNTYTYFTAYLQNIYKNTEGLW